MKREIEFAEKKIMAGAEFVIAPPVYDVDWFAKFMEGAGSLGVPVIPTVFLLKSVGIARYISINEPSAHLPEDLITRIRKSSDRANECVKIAGDTIKSLKALSQGVQIDALGWEHVIPAILEHAGM
jgi:5,10-methylenetetrahydrofolate reductase